MSSKKNFTIGLNTSKEQLAFLKDLTGKSTDIEACEHFMITCLEYSLKPVDVLKSIPNNIKPSILKDYKTVGNKNEQC